MSQRDALLPELYDPEALFRSNQPFRQQFLRQQQRLNLAECVSPR
jgi:hypothetical protein